MKKTVLNIAGLGIIFITLILLSSECKGAGKIKWHKDFKALDEIGLTRKQREKLAEEHISIFTPEKMKERKGDI